MKRMSSLRLTEAPRPVALMRISLMSLKLFFDLESSISRTAFDRRGRSLFGGFGVALGAHVVRPLHHRLHDVVVAGAAADIAFELVADRRLVYVRTLAVDDIDRRHDHSGSTEPALQAVIVLERLLHRMQFSALGKSLDRQDARALARRCERRARLDRAPVDMDHASAALRGVAADVGARQTQVFAQVLHQQRARIDLRRRRLAVDRHGNSNHQTSSLSVSPYPRRPRATWREARSNFAAKVHGETRIVKRTSRHEARRAPAARWTWHAQAQVAKRESFGRQPLAAFMGARYSLSPLW